jgi:hypothetical protein
MIGISETSIESYIKVKHEQLPTLRATSTWIQIKLMITIWRWLISNNENDSVSDLHAKTKLTITVNKYQVSIKRSTNFGTAAA